jgi:predicted nucleic acid-binding protein
VLLIDTGVLVAIADTTDPHHDACAALLQNETEPLVTSAMVIAETAYLLDRDLGPHAEALLYQMILDEDLHLEALLLADWQRVHDLVLQYADQRLGGTDAGLIALAERHRQQRIATLNRRHFSVVRPAHIAAFALLPADRP